MHTCTHTWHMHADVHTHTHTHTADWSVNWNNLRTIWVGWVENLTAADTAIRIIEKQAGPPPPPHTHTHTHRAVKWNNLHWKEYRVDRYFFLHVGSKIKVGHKYTGALDVIEPKSGQTNRSVNSNVHQCNSSGSVNTVTCQWHAPVKVESKVGKRTQAGPTQSREAAPVVFTQHIFSLSWSSERYTYVLMMMWGLNALRCRAEQMFLLSFPF